MVYNILMINLIITENDSGQRIDRFLRKYFRNAPLSHIYKLIRTDVKVNGKKPSQNQTLQVGDLISIYITEEEAQGFLDKKPKVRKEVGRAREAKADPVKVVYQDQNILIVDKPAGLLTHETKEEKVLTLSNQVLAYLTKKGDYKPEEEKVFKPGPANRLDRNTSGLVSFGKNAQAARALAKMFRERGSIDRYYLALVKGKMQGQKLLIDDTDKYMETQVKVLESKAESLVEAMLITGRTHQIRKQLAAEGYPIVGDVKYGGKEAALRPAGKTEKHKLYLHGWKLVFNKCPEALKSLEGKEIISLPPWDGRIK